jgi:hypothetical protein
VEVASLTGIFMHSDVPAVGKVSSSNSTLDKTWSATNASYLSNLYGYPTDCPQREKNGWTGDAHIAIETGLYNFDAITVYEKWLADHRDEQLPTGYFLPSFRPVAGAIPGPTGPTGPAPSPSFPGTFTYFMVIQNCWPIATTTSNGTWITSQK